MPYQVERNRHTKTARLVYVATVRSKGFARRRNVGQPNRRTTPELPDGSYYHVTKGWRR
jgi:hypothetical protein